MPSLIVLVEETNFPFYTDLVRLEIILVRGGVGGVGGWLHSDYNTNLSSTGTELANLNWAWQNCSEISYKSLSIPPLQLFSLSILSEKISMVSPQTPS